MQAPFIAGGEIFAAGTTVYKTKPGSAGTVRSKSGIVTGQTSVRSYGGMSSAGTVTAGGAISGTTLTASSGIAFAQGNFKRFASGTYYGIGGATAPIISTGLTTIHRVFMQANRTAYTAATTGVTIPRPCRAPGTLGSFYPIAFKIGGQGEGALNTVAATFQWMALGV